jgi:hypothetical protein
MVRTYVYKDGKPVPEGFCVMPDNTTTTLNVTLRSQGPISLDVLKKLLQSKYEVTELVGVESVTVVR